MSLTYAQLIDGSVVSISFGAGTQSTPSLYYSVDTTTGIFFPGTGTLALTTSGTERLRVDSSGRLLLGTSTARTNLYGSTYNPTIQIEAAGFSGSLKSILSICNNSTIGAGPILALISSGDNSIGAVTIVANGAQLGTVDFLGTDGTKPISGASIASYVDGTPGTNDMPGRLVFSTTADGATSPTERVRIDSAGNVSIGLAGSAATAYLHLAAGGTAASTSSLKLTSGSLLTTAEVGATEFDGSSLYFTTNTTSTGRGQVVARQIFRLAANGSAIGPAIADYFGATSSINLPAAGVFEIEYFLYFTKTTAGTVTFTLTASSAPTGIFGTFIGAPATGVGSGAPQSGYTGAQAAATAAFPATASLTTAVNHTYTIRTQIITNAATTFKVQVTSSAGTVTPLAGSFYAVRRVAASTGSFA